LPHFSCGLVPMRVTSVPCHPCRLAARLLVFDLVGHRARIEVGAVAPGDQRGKRIVPDRTTLETDDPIRSRLEIASYPTRDRTAYRARGAFSLSQADSPLRGSFRDC